MLPPLVLAFLGDAVFELIVRTKVIDNSPKVHQLHKQTANSVKAEGQANYMRLIMDELTDEELRLFKRGRNANTKTTAKNQSINDYRTATGFEALIGYLYLIGDVNRLEELMETIERKVEVES